MSFIIPFLSFVLLANIFSNCANDSPLGLFKLILKFKAFDELTAESLTFCFVPIATILSAAGFNIWFPTALSLINSSFTKVFFLVITCFPSLPSCSIWIVPNSNLSLFTYTVVNSKSISSVYSSSLIMSFVFSSIIDFNCSKLFPSIFCALLFMYGPATAMVVTVYFCFAIYAIIKLKNIKAIATRAIKNL